MKKEEFKKLVEMLAKKADEIPFDDYSNAMRVIREFKQFVGKHYGHLNQYVLEHIGIIEADFNNMRKSKKHNDKVKYWRSASRDLKNDIESMADENDF